MTGPATRRTCLLTMAGLLASAEVRAQAHYPSQPLRIVVPVAAGGLTDQLGRFVGSYLARARGQPVVIDNRPGASMIIGTQAVARAAPDGNTLLVGSASSLVLNKLLRRQLPYDPQTELTVLSVLLEVPFVLVVNPATPAHNLAEFLAFARADPRRATYGSAGVGTSTHLPGEMLQAMSGTELTHVPYSGNGPALTAVLGGDVTAIFDTLSTSLHFLRDGKLRAIAVTTRERIAVLPDVPTIAESGFPGYETVSWQGIAAPAGLAVPIAATLRETLNRLLQDGAFRERFTGYGTLVQEPRDAAAIERYVEADRRRWADVISARGIVVE